MKKSVCGVHRRMLGVSWEIPKKLAVLAQHPVAGVLMSQGLFQIQDSVYLWSARRGLSGISRKG